MNYPVHPTSAQKVSRERLRGAMTTAGLDQSELARRVGCTPGAINQLLSGNSRTSKFLPAIARELDVSVDWLLGEAAEPGEKLVSRELIAEQLDAVMIPEVQISFSMGGGAVQDEWPLVQMVPFSRAWLRGLTSSGAEHLMIARGDGDSMVPTIFDQDLVIIDRAQQTPKQQDRIWALSYGGLGMVKRLRGMADGSFQIHSDNKAVSMIEAADGELHVVGRVVGVVRRI